MAVTGAQSEATVRQQPKVETSKKFPIRSSPHTQSSISSPSTGAEELPMPEWHMCPHCKTIRSANSSSTSTSPTTSDLSNVRSISFARLGLKIKKDLLEVFSLSQETPSSTSEKAKSEKAKSEKDKAEKAKAEKAKSEKAKSEKAKVSKSKSMKKKKPQKKVYHLDNGYEELGGDHWADEY